MDLIVTGVVAGVLGTLMMDSLNHLFARMGMLSKIDMGMLGRMAVGWTHGCFRYRHPGDMEPVTNETFYGYITHYAIGLGFAIPFVLGWDLLIGGLASPAWTLAYGIVTTVASIFFVYPSMGLGVFGRRSPEGIRAPLSSLANHFFFGLGMAFAVVLV